MILIDYREPHTIADQLKLRVPIKTVRLPIGDYIIGDVVIERKTVSDLVHSAADHRLWNQLHTLHSVNRKTYILVEGTLPETKQVCGLINYAVIRCNVPVIYTKDPQHTASLLYTIFLAKRKPPPTPLLPSLCTHIQPQYAILCQFPLIGIKTARVLLQKFGNLSNIFQAPPTQLKEILGKKQHQSFRQTLDSRIHQTPQNS